MILSCIDLKDRQSLIKRTIMLEIYTIFYFHFDGKDLTLKLEF